MNSFMNLIFSADFLFTAIRVMTPVLFAALSCMVFVKGGIDAIATEGIMLICALAGVLGSYYLNNAFAGLLVAALTGAALACLFGYVTLSLKSEPVLTGIALNTFAGGITIFTVFYVTGEKGSTQNLSAEVLPDFTIPILKDIPVLGDILSGHNVLTYLSLILVVILSYFIYKTPAGLRIRAAGENPVAAKTVGINVTKYKYTALVLAGMLAGLGGAFMSMGYVSFFSKDMIAGRGFIGMAAESMGLGNPLGILFSSFIFGLADSLAIRLQLLEIPPQIIRILPYFITISAISIYSYRQKNNYKKKKSEVN